MTVNNRRTKGRFLNKPIDNVGNVKTFLDVKIPSDSLGNIYEGKEEFFNEFDNIGNSIEDAPAHLGSGLLSGLTPSYHRNGKADNYVFKLKKDFNKLLSLKQGLPFVFSLKKFNAIKDEENYREKLISLESLLFSILHEHEAEVQVGQYKNHEYQLVIFYIKPKSDNPSLNKDLIAALRKVLEAHVQKEFNDINVFLVLYNAKEVMEEHLNKLGVSKI